MPVRVVVVWCPGFSATANDVRAFEPIVVVLEALVPAVEILQPGVAAFAARGPARYYGGERPLVDRVTEAVVAAGGAGCRTGIAEGIFGAAQAARRRMIVAPGETEAFLAALPVETLGDAELSNELRRLGVETLGDLAALPGSSVATRFGTKGSWAHRVARGLDEEPVVPREAPPNLVVTMELDPPAQRVDTVAFAARTLAAELSTRLAARGLTCAHVAIEAETTSGETLSRRWRHDGRLTAAALVERARWQLEAWVTARARLGVRGKGDGLRLLRLVPERLYPDRGHQLTLTDEHTVRDEQMERVLARLQGVLGDDAVATPVLIGGRDPHDRVRLVTWGQTRADAYAHHPSVRARGRARKKTPPQPSWPGQMPSPAPATVYAVPRPAEVRDADGRSVSVDARGAPSADPAEVSVDGGPWRAVTAWAGPWPLIERWWDPRARKRYARWQMLTAGGEAHLLSVRDGRWHLDATYD